MGWKELVDSGFESIGISKDIRDALQPAVDAGKNLLPKNGVIPDNNQGVANANPQYTGPDFTQMILGPKIAGIPVVPVVIVGLIIALIVKK